MRSILWQRWFRVLPLHITYHETHIYLRFLQAAIVLTQVALRVKANFKFMLMSETSIPIYPPSLVYLQLAMEITSRVNSCENGHQDVQRWDDKMRTAYLKKIHFRKSQQWFGLTRKHAILVTLDRHVTEQFKVRYLLTYQIITYLLTYLISCYALNSDIATPTQPETKYVSVMSISYPPSCKSTANNMKLTVMAEHMPYTFLGMPSTYTSLHSYIK